MTAKTLTLYKHLLLALALGMAITLFGLMQAHAFEMDTVSALPEVELLSQEEFEKQTTEYQDVPFNDSYLAYSVRIPNNWTKAETDLTIEKEKFGRTIEIESRIALDVLGVLARFDGPPSTLARSYFTIEALEQKFEITAKSWLTNFVLANGYTLQGMNVVSDRKIEAEYTHIIDDISLLVHMTAEVNGPRIIVARYFVPVFRAEEEQVMQVQTVRSFQLLDTEGRQVETRGVFEFVDQSYFDYPVSWKVRKPNFRTVERMKVSLFNLSKVQEVNGRIEVNAISKLLDTSLPDEITYFMKNFDLKDYYLSEVESRPVMRHHPEIQYAKTEIYDLIPMLPNMMDYELWATILEGEDYYYILTLLTPTQDEAYELWTRNTEAYKVVVSTLRRYK